MSIPVAKGVASEKSAAPDSTETVTKLPALHIKSLEELQEDARRDIARRLVFAYLVLLAFSVVIPIVLLWVPRVSSDTFSVTDARDLMLAMSGTLSGLVGILGFVMGYYFKSLDKPAATTARRPATPRKS